MFATVRMGCYEVPAQIGCQELFVSLYGEVQKEDIEATLANDSGIGVTFRETTTICTEHMLLAVVRETDSAAGRLLANAGVDSEMTQQWIVAKLATSSKR